MKPRRPGPGVPRREFLHAGAWGVGAAALAPPQGTARDPRPRFALRDTEPFDAAQVPAYAGQHRRAYRYIDAHVDAHLEAIRRWIRQPSVSAQGTGIEAMAALLAADLAGLGFRETGLVPTAGHPGVFGYYDAAAPRTLLVYLMYDVQPVEREDWTTPPFAAEMDHTPLGRIVRGRGAMNQKGPQRAFLNAVEAVLAMDGTLPVNLLVVAEGEEELGSPHYPEIVDRYEERMRGCHAAFFPFLSQGPSGSLTLFLGVKGILYFELIARGGSLGGPRRAEIHGSYKALVDAPAWRLVQALASLTSADGNTIRVPGYYEPIRPPTAEEQRLIAGLLDHWNEAEVREALGVDAWVDGISGADAIMRYLFDTTLNIDGLVSGYTGEGSKTILPHVATAKVDSRLVPHQRPDAALRAIREHLERSGFADVEVRQLSGYPPAQTSVDSEPVRRAIGVFNKYGHTPVVWPRLAGSAPFYQFTERLGLPLVPTGLGHGSGAHAPDEYMLIDPVPGSRVASLAEIEKGYVDLLYALAE